MERPRSRVLADVAHGTLTQESLPEETMVSLPVPVVVDSGLAASFFAAITVQLRDGSNHALYRPVAWILVAWDDGRVLRQDLAPDVVPIDQDRPMGLLYPPELSGSPSEELEARILDAEWEVHELLDRVAPSYARNEESPDRQALAEAFRRVVSDDARPFYEELNPTFFAWLDAPPAPQFTG